MFQNKTKKTAWIISAVFFTLAVFASCGKNGAEARAAAKTELVIAITKDINGLDPQAPGNTLTQAILYNFFEPLMMRNPDDEIIPCLAVKWENINPTTWRFTLKEGVKFHSGNPLTSDDVVFFLTRIQDKRFSERANYETIEDVKVIDPLNFEIVTKEPDPILLNRLSRLAGGILDSKKLREVGEDVYLKSPSGTGPYILQEWKKDEQVVIVKNPAYHGKPAVWEKVTFRAIPESSTRVAELLTGGVDIALDVSPNDEDRVNANNGTHIERFPTKRILYWVVRTSSPGLDDPRVREAIDLAVDDQAIVDQIYNGAGTVTRSLIAPNVFGSNPAYCGTYLYDLERAKQLLAESNRAGFEIELASGNGQYLKDKEFTELMGAMLEQAGFKVKYSIMDTSRFTELKNARKFESLRMNGYSSSMSDASKDLQPYLEENPIQKTDWVNAEFRALGEEALVIMNQEKRRQNYMRMQELMAEERPIIPVMQLMGFYGVSDALNYKPRLDEFLYADEITLK
jgi:peptide/nickel transport system substrate-binding protein